MTQHTKDYQRKWRAEHSQWHKDYREQNKEKIKIQSRARYLRNKEHNDALRKAWYKRNKPRIIAKHRKNRETIEGKIYEWKLGAKRRNIAWNLTSQYIKSLPLVCHYTGLPLTLEVGHTNTFSIDRIDSSKPYTSDNIVSCCSMINTMKYDCTKSEFVEMCKQVASHQNE